MGTRNTFLNTDQTGLSFDRHLKEKIKVEPTEHLEYLPDQPRLKLVPKQCKINDDTYAMNTCFFVRHCRK